ncbi:hypothetical protein G8C93_00150 [Cellulosimicrobium cellulans]|uniref:hypothetical protein n=1 Tax=Cellulosimicrobium cellulans TaxID=1710 RepID=UPI00188354D5|nr:hypothetical protein [Cellulosimicrobium cellulans]MBE9924304.1 hypothetical protein [Cellulosimicrobium cellulans]
MLWDERFKSSGVWQYVEQARAHMNASTMPTERGEQDALAYVGMVLELLEERRNKSDAREVSPAMLNNLGASVSNLANYVESVNSGSYQWSQITPHADAVLDTLASWPPMKIAHYLSGLSSATDAFQNKAAQAIEELSGRETRASMELDELQSKQEALSEAIGTERQRITEAIATFTTEASEAVSDVRDAQDQKLSELLTQWSASNDDARQEATQTLTRLNALEEQARNVVHATTSHIVATDYGRYARNKTIAAWVCDIAAALVGAGGLLVIVHHLLNIEPDADSNVGLSLTRLAVSLGTLWIAGLLGRRGQQHHLEARAAKRTDLALRQILPFTANLDEDEQQKIIREFTDRVFIRGDIDTAQNRSTKEKILSGPPRKGPVEESKAQ